MESYSHWQMLHAAQPLLMAQVDVALFAHNAILSAHTLVQSAHTLVQIPHCDLKVMSQDRCYILFVSPVL